jgi:phosphoribosylaminoimidazole-succinocarboxamide synthase
VFQQVEGKTKIITPGYRGANEIGIVRSKNDITAGDGKKHDVLKGKARLANETTVHVFELLKKNAIPLAYMSRYNDTAFLAHMCTMVPIEVVVRYQAYGSYLERNPKILRGSHITPRVVEFYYKTSGKQIAGESIECDDPLMLFEDHGKTIELYNPHEEVLFPMHVIRHMSILEKALLYSHKQTMYDIAREVGSLLRRAWDREAGTLIDLKIEFGINYKGELVVADVIDCDSWRVVRMNQQLSKQPYRDGAPLSEVLKMYKLAEKLTRNFV